MSAQPKSNHGRPQLKLVQDKEGLILALAARGFSAKCISKKVRMSLRQVTYRIYKHDAYISSYRNGENQIARDILAKVRW